MRKAWLKWIIAVAVLVAILLYSVLFTVYEGDVAVVTRFGAARQVIKTSGLHAKLPWPFEQVYRYDGRKQSFDTSYIETLTKDKKNVILQAYVVWYIDDPLLFLQSTGNEETAKTHLNSLVTNAKNTVLGKYDLSALVSTDTEKLKLDEIEKAILEDVHTQASKRYGVEVEQIGFKRIGLPEANINQVFEQMRSERQRYVAKLMAEGERDASAIRNETDVEVAKLKSEGVEEAAKIKSETEKEIAKIYADAQKTDPELYSFLKKMETLEQTVGSTATLVFSTNHELFSALDQEIEEDSGE